MGMSRHIQAFIPETDEEFKKHKKILLMCLEHKVSLPKETAEYFGSNDAEEYLLDEKLQIELEKDVHYKEWSDESCEGFEVDLSKLPKEVTILRFFNGC
jgi:hypothetical protein